MKSDCREVLSVDYLNSINCWAMLEELLKVIPYHSDNYKQMRHHHFHLLQRTICNVVHCCCFISYGKSLTSYDIPIFDSAYGRINW